MLTAMLSLSVAPLVKTTLPGSQPASAATAARARSTTPRTVRPSPCTDDGLPVSAIAAVIAAAASGRSGALAL